MGPAIGRLNHAESVHQQHPCGAQRLDRPASIVTGGLLEAFLLDPPQLLGYQPVLVRDLVKADTSPLMGRDYALDHGHSFDSVSVEVAERQTIRLAFEEFLETLPPEIYRAKGLIRLDDEIGMLIFHVVGGRMDLWMDEERNEPGRLVFIGRGIAADELRTEVGDLFGMEM